MRISSRRAVIGSQSASSSLNSRTSNHSTLGTARPNISRSIALRKECTSDLDMLITLEGA
jgi:hypothetical protein